MDGWWIPSVVIQDWLWWMLVTAMIIVTPPDSRRMKWLKVLWWYVLVEMVGHGAMEAVAAGVMRRFW